MERTRNMVHVSYIMHWLTALIIPFPDKFQKKKKPFPTTISYTGLLRQKGWLRILITRSRVGCHMMNEKTRNFTPTNEILYEGRDGNFSDSMYKVITQNP